MTAAGIVKVVDPDGRVLMEQPLWALLLNLRMQGYGYLDFALSNAAQCAYYVDGVQVDGPVEGDES